MCDHCLLFKDVCIRLCVASIQGHHAIVELLENQYKVISLSTPTNENQYKVISLSTPTKSLNIGNTQHFPIEIFQYTK